MQRKINDSQTYSKSENFQKQKYALGIIMRWHNIYTTILLHTAICVDGCSTAEWAQMKKNGSRRAVERKGACYESSRRGFEKVGEGGFRLTRCRTIEFVNKRWNVGNKPVGMIYSCAHEDRSAIVFICVVSF